MTSFTWTEGQKEFIRKIEVFFDQDDNNIFLLSGSAGTGKTSICGLLPGYFQEGQLIVTGPTHKSVHVLREKLDNTPCMTIHKFLGLKPKRIKGESVLVRSDRYDPSEYMNVRVVLVDEASMLSAELLRYIKQDLDAWGRQYILVGDKYQLPPVNEIVSPCFAIEYLPEENQTELLEVVRQANDNPVIAIATSIRNAIIDNKEPPFTGKRNEDNVGVYTLKRQRWLEKLAEAVLDPRFKEDPDWLRILAYKNETVHFYNQKVREILGEDLTVPFSEGDLVTAKSPWIVQDEVIIMTGDEFEVLAIEPCTHPVYPQLHGYWVSLKYMEDQPVYVLDYMRSAQAYKDLLQAITINAREQGDWRPYYALEEYYADLRPVYAITVHSSQGSTFDNVMVDFQDIYVNKKLSEADRCYYVAVTRARRNVILLG